MWVKAPMPEYADSQSNWAIIIDILSTEVIEILFSSLLLQEACFLCHRLEDPLIKSAATDDTAFSSNLLLESIVLCCVWQQQSSKMKNISGAPLTARVLCT